LKVLTTIRFFAKEEKLSKNIQ